MELAGPRLQSSAKMTIEEHLTHVEKCLREHLSAQTRYPPELAGRLSKAGGKRVRPVLLIATYQSLEAKMATADAVKDEDLHVLASVAELVHMATLFHDDVIDQSVERRGIAAAQTLYGNKMAILVGDFVYAEAFARLMEKAFLYPSQRLAKTIQKLVEGEILQHEIVQSRKFTRSSFIKVAELKTASLFSWCAETGAWAVGRKDLLSDASSFGHHLGIAFQLIDDIIDTLSEKDFSPSFCKEFLASAPSYLMTLLCLSDPASLELWQKLPELEESKQRETIISLIQRSQDPALLSACQESVEISLQESQTLAAKLGNSDTLVSIVEQLRQRSIHALKGERLM